MASIDIAVCATVGGESLGRCLDAVAAQEPARVRVVLVDLGDAEAETAAQADPTVLRVAGPGLAAARNAALAASDADVVAFIEDDVVVGPGWLAALSGAWDAAPDRVAAIGGPIELALAAAPPPWFSDALHPSYATLDFGAEAVTLDPTERTLHGGNLSVRCAPLRSLGGFWPARGHADGRDWFSEEHHAQRELAEAGWWVRYEPGARVARVPPAELMRLRRVLRRRWRYGARMGVAAEAPPLTATATQAASSAAGVVLAAARRQPELAVARAARAAQNSGLLVGRPLAARDFRVTGPRPFGHSVPRAPRRRTRRGRRPPPSAAATNLLYHRVAEPTSDDGMCVAPARFAEQIEQIAGHTVLGLGELVELARAERVPADAVVVTFDDGYHDVLVNAQPVLAAAGIPATIFVATGHVELQQAFFWDEVERLLLGPGPRPGQLELTFPDGRRAWRTDTPDLRRRVRHEVHHLIQPASRATIAGVLAELTAWAEVERSPDAPRAMTVDELRTLLTNPLMSVGAHTRWHTNLGFRDEAGQSEEIERSRDDLYAWLGESPVAFAYPFGIPGVDFHASTRRLVGDAGFRHAVANQPGGAGAHSDPYALPRYFVPDLGGDEFATWLHATLLSSRAGGRALSADR